jgi:UDP-N-acetylglucosamine acyltransferase
VGLRRAGLSGNQMRSLKQAYTVLMRSGLGLDKALEQLRKIDDPLVDHLVEFIRKSERGFCKEERK